MALRIYNTLTGKKEIFKSLTPNRVNMYVCGPTVYDSCHIGHARAVVVFDVVFRYLESIEYKVKYVRNFTDVDDKIINRANERGVTSKEISKQYIAEFYEDMDALNVKRATIEPLATEHIGDIIDTIKTLIKNGNAYHVDGGDVFFAVESFEGYGKLSGRKLEDMEAGSRVDVNQSKKNPFDFALWKLAKPNEPSWDSPWGKGRPGWHIECTAMSSKFLGETFDIHGGGKDLIFPHHENEIAQSEAAFGKTFVNYWMHNGFVNINQEKMSKSLGNFTIIRDVLKCYDVETIRFFLLSKHYRSPIDFTDKSMDEAKAALDKIYALLKRVNEVVGFDNCCVDLSDVIKNENRDLQQSVLTHHCDSTAKNNDNMEAGWNKFIEAMDDDFNTALGIGVIFDTVRMINRILDENSDKLTDDVRNYVIIKYNDILKMGSVLGFLLKTPEEYFVSRQQTALQNCAVDACKIESLIEQRKQARKNRDFAMADQIRDQLIEMKIVLKDKPDGTTTWCVE